MRLSMGAIMSWQARPGRFKQALDEAAWNDDFGALMGARCAFSRFSS
jgi:hypothetical protein